MLHQLIPIVQRDKAPAGEPLLIQLCPPPQKRGFIPMIFFLYLP